MTTKLQDKLLHYELPPPEGSWQVIAGRLQEEYSRQDAAISQKIDSIEWLPPANAWENIQLSLAIKESTPVAGRVVKMNWRRWAIAALVLGISSTILWLYNSNTRSTQVAVTATVPSSTIPDSGGTPDQVPIITNRTPIQDAEPIARPKKVPVPLMANNRNPLPHPIQSAFKGKKHFQPIDITETAAIAAPLLRDANGNVIMDMSLITSASNNYISVTGPNGQQTRISSKFANYLMYLNKDESEKEEYIDYLIRNSNFWKTQFEQWRNKILQQASFIPSSANFFDILELKELLKDNQ